MNNTQILLIFLALIYTRQTEGFVQTRAINGVKLYQAGSSITINHDDSYVLSGAGSDSTADIVADSVSQWNGHSNMTIQLNQSVPGPAANRNDLYYSSTSLYFGSVPSLSGVLAVTAVSYETISGRIVEADIVVNDSKTFTREPSDTNPGNSFSFFLGDIISHEFGHFLGLGHSQVNHSTMIFTVNRGQHTVDDDDKAGVNSIYPTGNKGSISGTVIGGNHSLGVFGAEVFIISTKKGKAVASNFSDNDGSFSVGGLDLDDMYYVYVKPGNIISPGFPSSSPLPLYYTSAKKNFCNGGASYRGAFYQSCDSDEKGHPLGVYLDSSTPSQSIGPITIRCSMDTSDTYASDAKSSYLDLNDSTLNNRNIAQVNDSQVGEAIVGVFSSSEILNGLADTFRIDLEDAVTSVNSPVQKYVEIKLISGSLYGPTRTSLSVTNQFGSGSSMSPTYNDADEDFDVDSGVIKSSATDENPILEQFVRYPLSSTLSDNKFEIEVLPQSLQNGLSFPGSSGSGNDWFFPVSTSTMDNISFYLLTVNITTADGTILFPRSYSLSDNNACTDGPNTYAVDATVSEITNLVVTKKTDEGLACGSISTLAGGDDNPPSNGVASIILGFLIISLLQLGLSRRNFKILH